MKKSIVFFTLITGVFLFSACKTLPHQEPDVSIQSVDITEVNHNGIKFLCKVQVVNPNNFDIPVPDAVWEFFINENAFTNGVFDDELTIAANSTSIVEVPVNLDYLEIFTEFASLKGTAQADYKIKLSVNFDAPSLKNKVWSLEADGIMPMLQAPKIGSHTMRVEKIERNRLVEWYVSVNVDNPNAFELPRPRYTFIYEVSDKPFIKRTIGHRQELAPSTSTPVVFGLLVYHADIHRVFPDQIASSEFPSQLKMTWDFHIPAFSEDNFELLMQEVLPLYR